MCIDKRSKERDGKTYIILENGQKMILPENIVKVPALLLLNENYKVLYGDNIQNYLKPAQEIITKESTNYNMEPMAFSLGGGGGGLGFGGIVSDNYSFLDMDSESLNAKGDGGLRQMHNYVGLNSQSDTIATPKDNYDYKSNKISSDLTIEQLQKQRNEELTSLNQKRM
jgi:hypothetical protein